MQSDFLKALKEVDNYTYTENGAVAYKSTGNKVLDAFGSLGAMMNSSTKDILNTFYAAFKEDKGLATKLLFYMRDIRGGQGMRRVFRIIYRSLAFSNPDIVKNNFNNVLFFGRSDDLFCLFDTPLESDMMDFVLETLNQDMELISNNKPCSLLAKWMPSINTSSLETRYLAKRFCDYYKMSFKSYRKILATLRNQINIVETKMSSGNWADINFETVPSKAAMIYSNAFMSHEKDLYICYLKDLAEGKVKVNANALFPVDIISKVLETRFKHTLKDEYLYDAMWKALPDYFEGKEETGICVVDTSGSMFGKPLEVALSLGMYCADKAKGPFKNHFITFSRNPKLQEITGNNIYEKVLGLERADWDMNTNLEKVFQLILDTAISNDLKQEDLPSKLYIISDMQFDEASGQVDGWDTKTRPITFMQSMKNKFIEAGYRMPTIVYWNVRASKCGMFQQKVEDEDCCMVSGYSSSLFKSIIDGTEFEETIDEDGNKVVKEKVDPLTIMLTTLNNERYSIVWVG